MPKRIFSVLLTLAMLISIVPMTMAEGNIEDLLHDENGDLITSVNISVGAKDSYNGNDETPSLTYGGGSDLNAVSTDKNNSTFTYFHGYNTYYQVDLGEIRGITNIEYKALEPAGPYMKDCLAIYVANKEDFSDKIEVYNVPFQTDGTESSIHTVDLSAEPKYYRYIRIEKLNTGHTGISLADISVSGYKEIPGAMVLGTTLIGNNVTNLGMEELFEISFSNAIDGFTVTDDSVYALKKTPVYSTGIAEWKKVSVNPTIIDECTIGIDISNFKSYNTYKLVVTEDVCGADTNPVVPYTSGEFTTGMIIPIAFNEDIKIVNAAQGMDSYRLTWNSATSSYDRKDIPHLVDGVLTGDTGSLISNNKMEVNPYSDSNKQFIVIDLGEAKDIEAAGVLGTDNYWYHYSPFDVYGTNIVPSTLTDVTTQATKLTSILYKDILTDHNEAVKMWGEEAAKRGKWTKTKGPVKAVENPGEYRYVIFVAASDGPKSPLEIFIYSKLKDKFGEWNVTEASGTRTFTIPVEYVNEANAKSFNMVITNYDEAGNMTNRKSVDYLSGTELSGTISVTAEEVKSLAVLVPENNDYSFMAPVCYYGFDGFNANMGLASDFEDAVSIILGDDYAQIAGKTVEPDDRIIVDVVKSDAKTAEEAFVGTDICWYAAADSDIGYSFNIPFSKEGQYYIRVSRYAKDNTVEYKYYSYKIIDEEVRQKAIAAIVEAENALDLSDAIDNAINDLGIISKESLINVDSVLEEGFIDTFADIVEIMKDDAVSAEEAVKILNTATVANALKNNDNSYMEDYGSLVTDNPEIKEYIENELKYSFSADIISGVADASGVTNIDSVGTITFRFTEKMNTATLTGSNISIVSGEKAVKFEPIEITEDKLVIDKSVLNSNSDCVITFRSSCETIEGYKLAQNKVFKFTTGKILNFPYKEGMTIKNVTLNKNVIAKDGIGSSYTGVPGKLVDGIGLTKEEVNNDPNKAIEFKGTGPVIDLNGYYEILAISFGGYSTSWSWHYDGIQFMGSSYAPHDEGEYKAMYSTISGKEAPIRFTADVENIGRIRYIWLKKTSLIACEFAAYAYVSDTGLYEWEVPEFNGSGAYTFKIPAMDAQGDYVMILNAYDAKGMTKATVVEPVSAATGELLATITAPSGTKGIKAMLVTDVLSMSQVKDSVTIGDIIENTNAPEKGWKITNDDDKIYVNAGAEEGLKKSDRAVITVISTTDTGVEAEEKYNSITNELLEEKLVYMNAGKFGDGLNYTLDSLPEGKYFVKITVSDMDGKVLKNAYYKYSKLAPEDKITTIDAFINGDANALKTAVETAINTDEVISKDMLGDSAALSSTQYYQILEYTKEMLYPTAEEKATVTTIKELTDIMNGAALVNSFYNGDNTLSKELMEDYGKVLGTHFNPNVEPERFNKVFESLKMNVNSGSSLSEILKWSGMLSYIQDGTNREKADALTNYATEFGIDLEYATVRGVSLERATEYLSGSNAAAYYGKTAINAAYIAAVDEAFKETIGSASKPVYGGNGGGGGSSPSSSNTNKPISITTNDTASSETVTEVNNQTRFSDMSNYSWANTAVNLLCERKVLHGYEDGTLRPEKLVTRGEFVKMLAVATEVKVVENAPMSFIDVPDDSWYFPYIRIAFTNSLCNGVSEYYFNPDGYITRQDMAVMIYNYMKLAGKGGAGEEKSFTDAEAVSDYAKEAVKMASMAGVINGYEDGSFRPTDNARRVDAAMMISKIIG